jgi:hypothetical protein
MAPPASALFRSVLFHSPFFVSPMDSFSRACKNIRGEKKRRFDLENILRKLPVTFTYIMANFLNKWTLSDRVADPHHFNAISPDPSFLFNRDPDLTFNLNADAEPDPDPAL